MTAGAEAIVYGQRFDGVVRITDRAASGAGRSYLLETSLDRDGYAAVKALVTDYVRQAGRTSAIARSAGTLRADRPP